ncbi:DUF397 domain-containing protein [Streptomyces albidus (ex Kaewkla and Franco 2022)]|uniref:DUF397 domain-containing protein n=1 Tax=Streptomyces albidus (ex Kaewkla and Franco 2022) TaxID=722709 RepID=UPI0015EF8983|nr:DUF397 domain-containing protein [Streptomyces albidus (ex Kaewkla and Franco 2022)]
MIRPTTGQSRLEWTKSSYSSNDGPNCVEVAARSHSVHIRDSKRLGGPQLAFTHTAFTAFLAHAAGRSPGTR